MFSHKPDHRDPCRKLFRDEYCPRGAGCHFSHEYIDPAEVVDLLQFWSEPVSPFPLCLGK
jgi:hypothetical protein